MPREKLPRLIPFSPTPCCECVPVRRIAFAVLSLLLLCITALILPGFATARQQEQEQAGEPEPEDRQDPAGTFHEDDIRFFNEQVLPILQNNCFECHGNDVEKPRGGLTLLSRDSILGGGDSGPAVDLDQPEKSLLLDAVNYETYEMPPSGQLPPEEIAILKRWVESGLPLDPELARAAPAETSKRIPPEVNEQSRAFWSFQPVTRPALPEVKNESWCRNEPDRFVLAKLEAAGLAPSPAAEDAKLVRRLFYDLTGLPPSAEEVEKYCNDDSAEKYEKLIERLLQSPHYGEKWGRHWLDLVRYAESNSFERDGTKPFVWRYRDYVIRSFNEDKPYDRFLTEQLAGDEMDQVTADSIIATGYYRLGQWDDEPADREQAVYDDLDDILATTCQTMLGLTVNCARCHDHKIDPVPTRDYYRMLAFFRNIRRYGDRGVIDASTRQLEREEEPDPAEVEAFENRIAGKQATLDEIEKLLRPHLEEVEKEDWKYDENRIRIAEKKSNEEKITREQFDRFRDAFHQKREIEKNPPHLYRVLCVNEHDREPPPTHVLIRGNHGVHGDRVDPGFISVLSPPMPELSKPEGTPSSGRRIALAKWITSPDNPMTARVMVNRIWQHHFGRGIVRTSSDFGFQGAPPTHPELLDWLADEFVASGWSIKQMHRLILGSATYRQSYTFDETANARDPVNDLFWRFDMRRLTAEEVRDSILAVSGQLNREEMFGPSVFEKLPEEVLKGQSMPGNGWGNSIIEQRNRRSIYIHVKRSLPVPLLSGFDQADTDSSCPVRFNTTQPTQALGLLNSEFTQTASRKFADRVAGNFESVEQQVAEVLRRVTQRPAEDDEIRRGVELMEAFQKEDGVVPENALAFYCLFALNLNEFIFLE